MVLGKRLPHEHIGVRHARRKSTMVLGKRFPREHIGVRHMVWQERPRQKKTGHPEDKTLSDVAEVRTFDWGSKGRVTLGINVSPPKTKTKKNLTPRTVQGITKKKAVIAVSKSLNGDMS